MRPLTIVLVLLVAGCQQKTNPAAQTSHLPAEFRRDILPEIEKVVKEKILATTETPIWGATPTFGMQDSANPMTPEAPYVQGARVLISGRYKSGAKIVAEGYYSHKIKDWQNVTITIDWPMKVKPKTIGNIPITAAYLAQHGLRSDLTAELMRGLGKGSMSSSSPINYQAQCTWQEKIYEVSTAIHRGEGLSLELQCGYFLKP